MALSSNDIYNLLRELNEYGATIYYMLENKKLKLDDITNVLFKDSIEKVNLVFPKFIERITPEDIENSKELYRKEFTRLSCIDRIIEKDQEKHQHLREIRNIVNLDKKVSKMIKERTYNLAYNLHYTEKILQMIDKCEKKNYLSIQEILKLYKAAFEILQSESDKMISSNIDSYYISVITN